MHCRIEICLELECFKKKCEVMDAFTMRMCRHMLPNDVSSNSGCMYSGLEPPVGDAGVSKPVLPFV